MKFGSLELARRVVATACITIVAAIFWAFMIAAICRYVFGLEDQRLLHIVISVAALCIGAVVLPKFWKLMANH